jgi:hypothetical protein
MPATEGGRRRVFAHLPIWGVRYLTRRGAFPRISNAAEDELADLRFIFAEGLDVALVRRFKDEPHTNLRRPALEITRRLEIKNFCAQGVDTRLPNSLIIRVRLLNPFLTE